jgi:hypothetical protein
MTRLPRQAICECKVGFEMLTVVVGKVGNGEKEVN